MTAFASNMLTALVQVAILFIIALVGFVCHKTGIYTEKASRLTTDLLFYIVAPAIIVRSFLAMEYNSDSLRGLLMALFGGTLFHLIGIAFSAALFNKRGDRNTACIFKYASAYGNAGYMALPLAQAILGAQGVFYCSAILVPFNIFSFTHGVSVMSRGEDRRKISLKKLVLNPGVVGVALGLPLFLLNVRLPAVVYQPISYIADLNTPLAMLMFGTYLASADWKTLFSDKRMFTAAAVKILAVPLLTLFALRALGFGGDLLTACVLSSAAPTANNTVMFAAKYGRDTALASKVTAFISVLSIVTMPVMIALAQQF